MSIDLPMDDTEALVAAARAGRPFILVDDKDRENEGDLCVAAQFMTPHLANFMIRECGGVICLALADRIADRLQLPLQPRRNVIANQAMFTVSIEARDGVTTGVSAADRATTIRLAADPTSGPDDFCTPGHVFPLRAVAGGACERAGHTEAAIEVARQAGLEPAAAICEIMNLDGSMARLGDLQAFAIRHDIKIGTIANLIRELRAAWKKPPARFVIVRSAYRPDIVAQLAAGAKAVLDAAGATCTEVEVSGSLEIPAAVQMLCQGSRAYDGCIVIGCLMKGATIHDEVIAYTVFPALDAIARDFRLPLGNAILTVASEEQAKERADPARQDRGGEAAKAALRMLEIKRLAN